MTSTAMTKTEKSSLHLTNEIDSDLNRIITSKPTGQHVSDDQSAVNCLRTKSLKTIDSANLSKENTTLTQNIASCASNNSDQFKSNNEIRIEVEKENSTTVYSLKSNDDENDDVNDLLYPGYAPVVFKCCTQESKPRIWCLQMTTSPWFERVSMFIIIVNCITLGMYQPCENIDKKCTSIRCVVLEVLDHSIHVFFTIEMCVKIMAMGFYGKETYLAETWNRLDFFIVMAG